MPNFKANQPGLRSDKEKPQFPIFDGKIPSDGRKLDVKKSSEREREREVEREFPTGEGVGNTAAEKNTESNVAMEKPDDKRLIAEVFALYENKIGQLNGNTAEGIKGWLKEHPADKVKEAINEAASYGAHSPAYINRILEDWKATGYKPRKRGQNARTQTNSGSKYRQLPTPEQLAAENEEYIREHGGR
jgi:DnaD/phage-associated family protein